MIDYSVYPELAAGDRALPLHGGLSGDMALEGFQETRYFLRLVMSSEIV